MLCARYYTHIDICIHPCISVMSMHISLLSLSMEVSVVGAPMEGRGSTHRFPPLLTHLLLTHLEMDWSFVWLTVTMTSLNQLRRCAICPISRLPAFCDDIGMRREKHEGCCRVW